MRSSTTRICGAELLDVAGAYGARSIWTEDTEDEEHKAAGLIAGVEY